MASRYRSLSKQAFSLLKSTTNKPTLQPKSTPSLFPARPSLTFSRPVPQLGAIQSLLPFNSAVSSARLTSCLSIDSRSSRSLSQGMPFGRSLLQRESLYRVSGEERSPEILILFHSSGLTSNQWRKLKNLWFPGRTLFRPSCFGTGKRNGFSHSLLIVQVPLVYCIWPKKHRIGWSSYLLGTPWTKICFYYMGNIDLL